MPDQDEAREIRTVAVLPYQDGREGRRYLLRRSEALECPADDPVPAFAAVSLMRGAGWVVTSGDLVPLGECFAGASRTLACDLFAVSLTGRKPTGVVDPFPSRAGWAGAADLAQSRDPLAHVLFVRLSAQIEPALRLPSLRLIRDVDDFAVGTSDEGSVYCRCPGDRCPSGEHDQTTLGQMIARAYAHIDSHGRDAR